MVNKKNLMITYRLNEHPIEAVNHFNCHPRHILKIYRRYAIKLTRKQP